ncbi:MAG: hypothetical protein KDD60_02755, partial [Bdellovibrionales bacterium]|nr:hypothetical protein [Bdellovibrionales bacterium]
MLVTMAEGHSTALSADAVHWNILSKDWNARLLPFSLAYGIVVSECEVRFMARIDSYSDGIERTAVFKSGLFHDDVFEIFIGMPNSPQYLEFHISPRGEWWGALFNSYRELERELPDAEVLVESEKWENGWMGSLVIPLQNFERLKGGEECTFHVAAILSVPADLPRVSGGNEKMYISSSEHVPTGKPDFHLQELRVAPDGQVAWKGGL